jgi:anti-sigma B factor antagonist
MEISTSQYKHCDMIRVTGRIDSATAPQLNDAINKLMDENHYKIVLDMSGVDFISSAGLRVLVNTQKSCKRYNRGELVLSSVTGNIRAALDLAGFMPLFRIFEDVTTAVGSF